MRTIKWQNQFFYNFLEQLTLFGYSPKDISRYVWKPFLPEHLNIIGPDRDTTFNKLSITPDEVSKEQQKLPVSTIQIDTHFFEQRKMVVLLLPGFTHHTLRNLSLHEQLYDKQSPHHIVRFYVDPKDNSIQEETIHKGTGLKIAYIAYSRSNANSDFIIKPLFELIHGAKTIRQWVMEEHRKLVFMGYSYGSPLSLELLSELNTIKYQGIDQFILKNTAAFLSLCGDIGGSYLADYVSDRNSPYNIHKAMNLSRRSNLLANLFGFKTKQDNEDIVGGVESLGHMKRHHVLNRIQKNLPSSIKYFSISACQPIEDYKNNLIKDFDDWSMYKQSLVSYPISIYNDGQVVLKDTLLPRPQHIPSENIIDLGAVRSHHWGVSYRTFQFGNNNFPRVPFYHALIKTLFEASICK
ncbi:MAG: hypothetical protein HQK77_19875 [Desulfobacterales bacterium]|nr:hypothetical protein [Desulfobacterales bacterium]